MRNDDSQLTVPKEAGIVKTAGHLLVATWNPQPIEKPVVDIELATYPFLVRSAEVLKYQMLRLEYSLSQGGRLRAWFKLNLLVGILLAVPVLFVVPAVTALLSGVASWSIFLLQTMKNLTMTLLWGIAFVVIIMTFIFAVGQIRQARMRARAQQQDARDG